MMLQIKSGNVSGTDLTQVVNELAQTINLFGAKLVIFFTSKKYDIQQVGKIMKQKFPLVEVIGCTTAGEISNRGFTEDSISAMCIASDNFEVSTFVMKDIKTKAVLAKDGLLEAGRKLGFSSNSTNGFIITLIDCIPKVEERVLTTINHPFPNLQLVGASAADSESAYLSVNGEVFQNAAIVTFVKTNLNFFIYKENIFVPTDTELDVTKADMNNRIIWELNGKPAVEEYARVVGVSISDFLKNHKTVFFTNPLGRIFGSEVWIAAPFSVIDGKGIGCTALVMEHTTVKLLKPIDVIAETKKTVATIEQKIPNCKGMILFNCLLRYMQFKQENLCSQLINEYNRCGQICGFNTYGEQLNKFNINQTLTLVAFGEK